MRPVVADVGSVLLLVFSVETSTETVRSVLIAVERRIGWKMRATEEIAAELNFSFFSYPPLAFSRVALGRRQTLEIRKFKVVHCVYLCATHV